MREWKTRQQTSDWINQRLQAFLAYADARATVQYEPQEPDSKGCTWYRDLILNYGTCDSACAATSEADLRRKGWPAGLASRDSR